MFKGLVNFIGLIGLIACYGCGDGNSFPAATEANGANFFHGGSGSDSGQWTPYYFQPAENFEARCKTPRSGIDENTGRFYPDMAGSFMDENNWLRSWSNDLYLWYNEISDTNPALYTPQNYFELMKTFAITPSGNMKDKFHFSLATADWEELSQSGVTPGYGAEWAIISDVPPRKVVIAYTHPNSPATTAPANLARGAEILTVDGVDMVYSNSYNDVYTLNAGLYPAAVGETHTFQVRDLGSYTVRTVTLQSTKITLEPVQNVNIIPTTSGNVGYLLFLDHIATAEQALIDAFNQLKSAGIVDLVLDLRYNGGGYLDIASEVAYMIAGAESTDGQTFESLRFNDKYPTTNPVTGEPLEPVPFNASALGFSAPFGQALPTLNLQRVYVLTGPDTCSASESIMNSLEGIDIEVIQIGSTTCGKPYGFYPTDNCGTTYFSIQFKGVNAKNFGDYTDGFSPNNTMGMAGTILPGCSVADDFTHALGNSAESRLAAALNYRNTNSCPSPTGLVMPETAKTEYIDPLAAVDGRLNKSPWLRNRTLVE